MKLLGLTAGAGAIALALWAGLSAAGVAPSPLELALRPPIEGAHEPGPLAITPFPAGRVRLARIDLLDPPPEPLDPKRFPVVLELDLAPAGETTLRLP